MQDGASVILIGADFARGTSAGIGSAFSGEARVVTPGREGGLAFSSECVELNFSVSSVDPLVLTATKKHSYKTTPETFSAPRLDRAFVVALTSALFFFTP